MSLNGISSVNNQTEKNYLATVFTRNSSAFFDQKNCEIDAGQNWIENDGEKFQNQDRKPEIRNYRGHPLLSKVRFKFTTSATSLAFLFVTFFRFSSAPTSKMAEKPDDVRKSEEHEGIGATVDRVIIFNVGMSKFDLFPVAGYPGGDSLISSTGINPEMPLSYNDRLRDVDLNYSAATTVKARIFMRFERGKQTSKLAT